MSLADRPLSLLNGSFLLWALALLFGLTACAQPGRAATETSGRVGRIAGAQAPAALDSRQADQRVEASGDASLLNWPVGAHDRLSTGPGGRLDVDIGSTRVRIGERAQLDIQRLDSRAIVLALHQGQASVWVRNPTVAGALALRTARSTVRPLGAALFRVDAADDAASREVDSVTTWRAPVEIEQARGTLKLQPGQRAELNDQGQWHLTLPHTDAFAQWALHTDEPPTTSDAIPPLGEMTGAQALASHGQWTQTAEHGWIWTPVRVDIGWAPYQRGRWVWMVSGGWVWVDAAPWGFAPFRYGQWIEWNGRWSWAPGHPGRHPIYTPAPPPYARPAPPPPHHDERRRIPAPPPRAIAPSPEPRMPEPIWRTRPPGDHVQTPPRRDRWDTPSHVPPGRDERTRPAPGPTPPPPQAEPPSPRRQMIPEPRRPIEPPPSVIETPRRSPPRTDERHAPAPPGADWRRRAL